METLTTLADCKACSLYTDCPTCRGSLKLSTLKLGMIYGWETPLDEVRRLLRCECGSADHTIAIAQIGTPLTPGWELSEVS